MAKSAAHREAATGTADGVLKRRNAYDAWNAAFLCRYYEARAAEIKASGDPHRIRLYDEHIARYAQRGRQ